MLGGLPQGMFGGQSEQGSEAGTEEEFVSAALGSEESLSSPEPEAEDGVEALPAWADAVLALVAEGARLTAAHCLVESTFVAVFRPASFAASLGKHRRAGWGRAGSLRLSMGTAVRRRIPEQQRMLHEHLWGRCSS